VVVWCGVLVCVVVCGGVWSCVVVCGDDVVVVMAWCVVVIW